ncbi:copper amine oxidase N-terminal domain-containing protein [Cohnella zeiphila]|uniref:Copper amine oxidase N-terminal domain-containing protein n=1 Tax=Cohnella zeiphila TaxID=2761120 RepID=A0A7X0SRP4_9BACL|nr:copper amine oxidase N-terminal domain-containing protein [Cohnella zeiphila]MBB6734908.1 copper amine oxidase N-terminal domain-containing protein [Cohnella zeiphila]
MQTPLTPATANDRAASRRIRERRRLSSAAWRKGTVRFAVSVLLLIAVFCLATFLFDPLQFYRQATWYPPIFSTQERYQNPGLARNYDYDTIILGTSMTENFLPSVVDKALHGKTLKLSMEGSMAEEQYKIADLALRTGKPKQVLWGLDYFAFKHQDPATAADFPDYLYDDDWTNDYRYLMNVSVYEMLAKDVLKMNTTRTNQDLEHLYNWNASGGFGAAKVLAAYSRAGEEEKYFGLNEDPLDQIRQSFETNVLSLVKRYPDVQFLFFYPPYSILRQDVWKKTNETRYRNQLEMSGWMYRQLAALPNAKVYDFQAESDWTYDLDLYKDLSHYAQDVNTGIAEAIGRDDPKYRMTDENADSFADKLEEQLQRFVITPDDQVLDADIELADGGNKRELSFSAVSGVSGADELLVPAKEFAAAVGASLSWQESARTLTLTLGGRKLAMTPDESAAVANGRSVTLDAAPKLVSGSTRIPLRSVAESLGLAAEATRPDKHTLKLTVSLR